MYGYFGYLEGVEPIKWGLNPVAAPASEPITLSEAKVHCRVDISDDDTIIGTCITSARQYIENILGRRLFTQTWDLILDRFPAGVHEMRCPWGPWQSITYIHYIDLSGNVATMAASDYNLDSYSFEPRIYLSFSKIYPVPRPIQNAVTIRHVSGATSVNENLKSAVKMRTKHLYDEARGVLDPFKLEKTKSAFDSIMAQERQSWL